MDDQAENRLRLRSLRRADCWDRLGPPHLGRSHGLARDAPDPTDPLHGGRVSPPGAGGRADRWSDQQYDPRPPRSTATVRRTLPVPKVPDTWVTLARGLFP